MMCLRSRLDLKNRCRRRGVAASELVCILPVLITIVFGCVDFGRFAYAYISVTNAARAGADFASTNRYTTSTASLWAAKIRLAVQDEMGQMSGFDPDNLSVTAPAPTPDGNLKLVSVQVTYQFRTTVTWPALPNQLALTRTVRMRVIRG
jgi:Flp pilus assembly protein TadG